MKVKRTGYGTGVFYLSVTKDEFKDYENCKCFYCGLKWKRHCDDNETGWAMCNEPNSSRQFISDICDDCYSNPKHRTGHIDIDVTFEKDPNNICWLAEQILLENDYEAHPEWVKTVEASL